MVLSASDRINRRGIYLGRRSTKIHAALYRWSNGRLGASVTGWPRARILLLDHVGAKSGIQRTSPVIFQQVDGVLAVAASKAGQPDNPAWFYNLRANPDTTIRLGSETRSVRARVASDAEWERLWPGFAAAFPAFETYRTNAGTRRIPIIVLDPR